ncbi:MAG: hypothetical protein E6Q97_27355 [Desulfurellales bacterium]|nr:MAG: hypothetical protein E6Q97_27355 [Desulfurellales bacterium]
MEIMAVREEILHLVLLSLPTVVVVVALAQVLLRIVSAVPEVVNAVKAPAQPLPEATGQAVAEMAFPSQAAARLAVLVVALGQTLLQLHRLLYTRATVALEAESEAALMRRTLQQVQQELAALAIWKRQVLQQVMAV